MRKFHRLNLQLEVFYLGLVYGILTIVDPELLFTYFLKCYRGTIYVGGNVTHAVSTNGTYGTYLWSKRLRYVKHYVEDIDSNGKVHVFTDLLNSY